MHSSRAKGVSPLWVIPQGGRKKGVGTIGAWDGRNGGAWNGVSGMSEGRVVEGKRVKGSGKK